jgi:hypothetical protein
MMTNICPQYNRGSDQSPKAVLTDKFGSSSVGEIFLHLFKEVIDITVENTNRRLRERKHNETDFGEISQVIGVMIANSIQQFPQEQQYWEKGQAALVTFPDVRGKIGMSHDRYVAVVNSSRCASSLPQKIIVFKRHHAWLYAHSFLVLCCACCFATSSGTPISSAVSSLKTMIVLV